MSKFRAIAKAYYGGKVVDPGEPVEWPAGVALPLWLGGKNAKPITDKVAVVADAVEAPKLSKAEQAKADKAAAKAAKTVTAAAAAEPFADAPEPVRVENEIAAALGTIEPDWVAPSGEAVAVAD